MAKTWSTRMIYAGIWLVFFGAYLLFLKESAVNQQQQYFRVGVFVAGFVFVAAGLVWKASNGSKKS